MPLVNRRRSHSPEESGRDSTRRAEAKHRCELIWGSEDDTVGEESLSVTEFLRKRYC